MSATRTELTVADGAGPAGVDAVCRAVLATVWTRLTWFELDLQGLTERAETASAAATLEPYRRLTWPRRRPTSTVHLVPGRDDAALDAVLGLLTRTMGSAALAGDGEVVYDVKDEGTSCWFELTDDERAAVEQRLRDAGASTDLLVPFDG